MGYGGFFSFWVLLWRKEEESGVDGRKLYFKEMLQAGSDFFPPAQAGSNWGDWGSASFCPEGSWATGFQLKVHLQRQHPRHCHKKCSIIIEASLFRLNPTVAPSVTTQRLMGFE